MHAQGKENHTGPAQNLPRTYWISVYWCFHQLVSKGGHKDVGHLLDEVGPRLAVVLDGQDHWILAGHKRKLINPLNNFLLCVHV